MASAAKKVASQTVLRWGQVEVPIGLFASADKPGGVITFDTAGPTGGRLKVRAQATPVLEAPAPTSDPLADDPGSDIPETATPIVSGPSPARVMDGEYEWVLVEDGTGEAVLPGQERKGVRLDDDRFIDCTEHLAQIERDTRLDRATIVSFVAVTQVPRARVKGSQYLGPIDAQGAPALRLLWEAIRATKRVAVVKLTKRSRQSLGVIGVHGTALMLYELVWREDFRPAPERVLAIQHVSVLQSEIDAAIELVDAMAGPMTELDELRDDAIARREELHARALAGEIESEIVPEPMEAEAVGMSLEGLLSASLEAVKS